MGLEVFWSELAISKLDEVYEYYKTQVNRKLARKIIKKIIEQTIDIEKLPQKGQIEELLSDDDRSFRYLIYSNYKIVYYINHATNKVIIATIFDTRQNPKKLKID